MAAAQAIGSAGTTAKPAVPALLDADQVLPELDQFDCIIDVRSPSEYAHDHIPGAINCPVLDDEQRAQVGTLDRQVSPFEARKIGAALVSQNIALHLQQRFLDMPKEWKPLVYCWRGGNRSGAVAHIFARIGWPVSQLEGGYQAYRRSVIAKLDELADQFTFRAVCGTTGSGKSRLLQYLANAGAQVLDLEDLACHRSSVLGHIPGQPQPSQKHFDTRVWQALRSFDPTRPVFVESESRKVGNLSIPESLMLAMRDSPCFDLQLSLDERVALLMEDYKFFVDDQALFCHRLDALVAIRGKAVVDAWKASVQNGRIEDVVRELLVLHYDPTYASSMVRNFTQSQRATPCIATSRHPESLRQMAQALCHMTINSRLSPPVQA